MDNDLCADTAVLLVDVQNDFVPSGRLEIPGAVAAIRQMNHWVDVLAAHGSTIVYTQDWHPDDAMHYCNFGIPHCVADTAGAAFPDTLKKLTKAYYLKKGFEKNSTLTSGLLAKNPGNMPLYQILTEYAPTVSNLVIIGLGVEGCIEHTIVDAIERGFTVTTDIVAIPGIARQENFETFLTMLETIVFLTTPETYVESKENFLPARA